MRLSSIRHTLCVGTAASEAANLPSRHLPQESDTSSDECLTRLQRTRRSPTRKRILPPTIQTMHSLMALLNLIDT